MLLEWNDGDYPFDPNDDVDDGSFLEHIEHLSESHLFPVEIDVILLTGPKYDEEARPEVTWSLSIDRSPEETGGTSFPNRASNWASLIPILEVSPYKLSPN